MNDQDRTRLLAFFEAQLDDEEKVAKAATPGPWRHDPNKHWRKPGATWFEEAVFAGSPGEDATCVAGTGETDDPQSMVDAAFIAYHHPNRVLAEINAKRALIKLHRTMSGELAEAYLDAIKVHSAAYADHPDFDMGWSR